jgi:hypothetical protein|tara:strand:- start:694 stop:2298 length:1605 start_codon:yes stop_codon:yes gene_type:complete
MALIKWKQLSKDLSTHANLTGSLKVTGSILLNGSAVSTAQASTGSLISTASATNNVITFTKGNNSTFNITVATGSGGGSSDLGALNSFSASVNTFTGSIDGEVTALMAATSSYVTNANTSSFISNSQTGSFLKDADTGSFITNSDTGSFLTDTDTGSFISNSQTSSMSVASASFNPVAYLSASTTHSLEHIEVADFDNDVAVSFTGNRLKFVFGTPTVPSSLNLAKSGFATNRFNKISDAYTISATWNNGGYNFVTASIFTGSVLLAASSGSGTSLSTNLTTTGSHAYSVQYTASSPLDGSIFTDSDTVSATLSKTNPGNPSISDTATIQLGDSSNQLEQGATGSIAFTGSYGSSNDWEQVSLVMSASSAPATNPGTLSITGALTGSSSFTLFASASYKSPTGENDPQLFTSRTKTTTFTKIISLRHGASATTAFTQAQYENLGSWDTTLNGDVGTIVKGDVNPVGNTVSITWTGDKYHYIVYDSSRSDLSGIATSGFAVLGQFTKTTVGDYKVYRTTALQAGGSGTTIEYVLS